MNDEQQHDKPCLLHPDVADVNDLSNKSPTQTVSATKKPWYQSKTLWFNCVALVAWVLYDFEMYSLPELAEQMTVEQYLYVSLVVNTALRFVTSQGIHFSQGKQAGGQDE